MMNEEKKGEISLIVVVALLIVVALIYIAFLRGSMSKAYGSFINPLKKMLGMDSKADLDRQQEAERVNKELVEIADIVYSDFKGTLDNCITQNKDDRLCVCGKLDLTRLNKHGIELIPSGNSMTMQLSDAEGVVVKDRKTSLGEFVFGPIDTTRSPMNSGKPSDYANPGSAARKIRSMGIKNIILSKDKAVFNSIDGELEKSRDRMNGMSIVKLDDSTIALDENGNGLRQCGAQINCAKAFAFYDATAANSGQIGSGLHANIFEICAAMDPNKCYRSNDQYISGRDCPNIRSINAIGCSARFDSSPIIGELAKGVDLNAGIEKDPRALPSGEALTKFKYVYQSHYRLSDLLSRQNFENRGDLEYAQKNLAGIAVDILLVGTISPFETEDNEASQFTRQAFGKFYSGANEVFLVASSDNRFELVFEENARHKFGVNDRQQCLDTINSVDNPKNMDKIALALLKRAQMNDQLREQKAVNFFNNLINGYENCMKEQRYPDSDTPVNGLIGACKCRIRPDWSELSDYTIEFEALPVDEKPYWSTTLSLKNKDSKKIGVGGSINALLRPCPRALGGTFSFPVTCPLKELAADNLRGYALGNELLLAKAKDAQSNGQFEVAFFGDSQLPDCP